LSEDESEEEVRRRLRSGPMSRPKKIRNNPDPSGLVFGLSTAGVLYRMASDMNKSTNLMLWMWIVGLTDQYVHMKIDKNTYE
jgi:cell division control protein 45